MGGLDFEGCACGGGGDSDADCWSGPRGEVEEKLRDAGEWGAVLEGLVLGADFGGPFVISNWQLGPVEELEHALI